MPGVDPDEDLDFHFNLSVQSSPGKTYEKEAKDGARQKWFEPESLEDLPELQRLTANDTSLGVGYAPMTVLERVTLAVEGHLNSVGYKKDNPWMGSDIKIMSCRDKEKFLFTLCLPQIAKYVGGYNEYAKNLEKARQDIEEIFSQFGITDFELHTNTRDDVHKGDFYLTAVGSSIESGDEGLVGRGNRINKVITPTRPMSMEGSCGKNPIYQVGKIYYVAAFHLAQRIYETYKIQNEVYVVSQSDRELVDPWVVAVNVPVTFLEREDLAQLIKDEVRRIPELSKGMIDGSVRIY